jgi:hypothetical protein
MNNKILQKFDVTDDEKQFIIDAQTATTADMNLSRVISDLYLSKTLEKITPSGAGIGENDKNTELGAS